MKAMRQLLVMASVVVLTGGMHLLGQEVSDVPCDDVDRMLRYERETLAEHLKEMKDALERAKNADKARADMYQAAIDGIPEIAENIFDGACDAVELNYVSAAVNFTQALVRFGLETLTGLSGVNLAPGMLQTAEHYRKQAEVSSKKIEALLRKKAECCKKKGSGGGSVSEDDDDDDLDGKNVQDPEEGDDDSSGGGESGGGGGSKDGTDSDNNGTGGNFDGTGTSGKTPPPADDVVLHPELTRLKVGPNDLIICRGQGGEVVRKAKNIPADEDLTGCFHKKSDGKEVEIKKGR